MLSHHGQLPGDEYEYHAYVGGGGDKQSPVVVAVFAHVGLLQRVHVAAVLQQLPLLVAEPLVGGEPYEGLCHGKRVVVQ